MHVYLTISFTNIIFRIPYLVGHMISYFLDVMIHQMPTEMAI